jgi:hypothetical protein
MIKNKLIVLTFVASSLMLLPSTAMAETFTLGYTWVLKIGNVKGTIPFPIICRNAKGFKIKAQRDLKLERVRVSFRNGEEKTYNYYRNIRKDNETGIRFFGYKRCIKRIEIEGNSKGVRAGVKVIGVN